MSYAMDLRLLFLPFLDVLAYLVQLVVDRLSVSEGKHARDTSQSATMARCSCWSGDGGCS